jgi:hypothetical protein
MVPIDTLTFIVTHPGEEHTAGLSLLDYVLNNLGTPVIVLTVVQRVSSDSQGLGGTKNNTAMAANTVLFPAHYLIILSIIVMSLEGALVDAHLTPDTPLRVSLH